VLTTEGPRAWARLGGAHALAALGVVAPELGETASAQFMQEKPGMQQIIGMHRILDVMHLEAWVRARAA
jgi:hypothetical protein